MGHISKKKAAKGRTRVSPQTAREIQVIYRVLVPVGSRKYSQQNKCQSLFFYVFFVSFFVFLFVVLLI